MIEPCSTACPTTISDLQDRSRSNKRSCVSLSLSLDRHRCCFRLELVNASQNLGSLLSSQERYKGLRHGTPFPAQGGPAVTRPAGSSPKEQRPLRHTTSALDELEYRIAAEGVIQPTQAESRPEQVL